MALESFRFPPFHDYPPYYTLQPVDSTKEKQLVSWSSLILSYCKHYKIFTLRIDELEESDLFCNRSIERKLSSEARKAVFDWMVLRGDAQWKDAERRQILVLWKSIAQWAETMLEWVYTYGLENSVVTVDEITNGEESTGTGTPFPLSPTPSQSPTPDLEGLDREIIIQAVGVLNNKGCAELFRGSSEDDIGIKFFKQH